MDSFSDLAIVLDIISFPFLFFYQSCVCHQPKKKVMKQFYILIFGLVNRPDELDYGLGVWVCVLALPN